MSLGHRQSSTWNRNFNKYYTACGLYRYTVPKRMCVSIESLGQLHQNCHYMMSMTILGIE